MKRGKNPIAAQKKLIAKCGMDPNDWLVIKWDSTEALLQNKQTGELHTLELKK